MCQVVGTIKYQSRRTLNRSEEEKENESSGSFEVEELNRFSIGAEEPERHMKRLDERGLDPVEEGHDGVRDAVEGQDPCSEVHIEPYPVGSRFRDPKSVWVVPHRILVTNAVQRPGVFTAAQHDFISFPGSSDALVGKTNVHSFCLLVHLAVFAPEDTFFTQDLTV